MKLGNTVIVLVGRCVIVVARVVKCLQNPPREGEGAEIDPADADRHGAPPPSSHSSLRVDFEIQGIYNNE